MRLRVSSRCYSSVFIPPDIIRLTSERLSFIIRLTKRLAERKLAMQSLNTDVVVVGAGPAGLTAAALLARAGVSALTVTKYGGTADSPRAHITNQRSMEIFRDLGIEERVMRRALPQHLMGKQVFATAFAGREICRMMTWGTGEERRADYAAASPCEMCNAPQHVLEPILLDTACSFGADIRFDHEVVAVRQTPEAAVARVRNRVTADEIEIRARYIVGCDGARSIVGEHGGFELEGQAGLGNAITVWIEADLTRYAKHRSGALFFVCNPGGDDLFSIWTCVEPWTEWSTIFTRHGLGASDMSEEAVMARVRAAVGDPAVDIKIKKISEWQINHVVAAHYRQGRLFLAGDAAHRHPPANGLGSNTSVQDSYNLAWKLALVVAGQADERLLDSYDAERQPVGRRIVDRANRSVREMVPWIEALGFRPEQTEVEALAVLDHLLGPHGGKRRQALLDALDLMNGQFNAHGVEMGQRYVSRAVVGNGSPFPAYDRDPDLYYHPTTHAGAPLPHVGLGRGTEEISTLDLCAYDRFTLITGVAGADWAEAAAHVSRDSGVRVDAVTVGLGQANNDVLGAWTRMREIDDDGCLLVRPDRVVAWRCPRRVADPVAELQGVMAGILGRS
jgi:2,4-dichlorophenol 6-monooxygenase